MENKEHVSNWDKARITLVSFKFAVIFSVISFSLNWVFCDVTSIPENFGQATPEDFPFGIIGIIVVMKLILNFAIYNLLIILTLALTPKKSNLILKSKQYSLKEYFSITLIIGILLFAFNFIFFGSSPFSENTWGIEISLGLSSTLGAVLLYSYIVDKKDRHYYFASFFITINTYLILQSGFHEFLIVNLVDDFFKLIILQIGLLLAGIILRGFYDLISKKSTWENVWKWLIHEK